MTGLTSSLMHSALPTAARIVSRSCRDHPADAVLREQLKAAQRLSPAEAKLIARTVFSFFRWLVWLDPDAPARLATGGRVHATPAQLKAALRHADDFRDSPERYPDAEIIERALPAWLSQQVEVTPELVRAIQSEPCLWLRARRGTSGAVAQQLGYARLAGLADSVIYDGDEDLYRSAMFHAGEFEIQDVGSQAVGLLCDPQPGQTWWDACAGEGGKMLHLSDLMENKGLIWASDRADWRLVKLKRRAARAKCYNYRSVQWDGSQYPPTKTLFHGALVDAPCTGIGTWFRNPHARWTSRPEDVAELAAAQGRLLHHVAPSLRPGARLVYAVCTLTRAETVDVCDAFEQAHPDYKPLPLANPFNPDDPPTARHRFLPQDTGGCGMFASVWQREGQG